MAAGLTIRTMDWEDILAQMDALEVPAKRDPYQKRKAEIQTEALPEIGGSLTFVAMRRQSWHSLANGRRAEDFRLEISG
jgi:hypothetical protein